MIPTLHPLADIARRWRPTPDGDEAEMTSAEAASINQLPTRQSLWWEVRNYSSAMYLTHRTAEALVYAERALLMKRTVSTLHNMAVILAALGRYDDALDYAEEAVASDPTDDRATAYLAESLLRAGDYARGWPLYIKNRASMDWCKQFLPEWDGSQPLKGKRILVIEGGGYGDNLYFMRWLHTLRHRDADVHYVCQPSLAPLARRQGFRAIENWHGNADIHWEQYAYFCPLLSLAGKLGVTLDNYRWSGPYIKAGRRPWWPTRRIGLCWRAGESTSQRKQRTLHNEQVDQLVSAFMPTHHWVNLVYNMSHPQAENPLLDDWLLTAQAIAKLDYVISVDTGVAHLAGAMGVPTFVILPGESAWHYPLGYPYHPLYPSMRIFRNRSEGLDEAVGQCAEALRHL